MLLVFGLLLGLFFLWRVSVVLPCRANCDQLLEACVEDKLSNPVTGFMVEHYGEKGLTLTRGGSWTEPQARTACTRLGTWAWKHDFHRCVDGCPVIPR